VHNPVETGSTSMSVLLLDRRVFRGHAKAIQDVRFTTPYASFDFAPIYFTVVGFQEILHLSLGRQD
jgi:hypothetical protein